MALNWDMRTPFVFWLQDRNTISYRKIKGTIFVYGVNKKNITFFDVLVICMSLISDNITTCSSRNPSHVRQGRKSFSWNNFLSLDCRFVYGCKGPQSVYLDIVKFIFTTVSNLCFFPSCSMFCSVVVDDLIILWTLEHFFGLRSIPIKTGFLKNVHHKTTSHLSDGLVPVN